MEEYKFHGELGYFAVVMLAPIERYVKKHPEKKGKIRLYTLEGYEHILENLFPGYFEFVAEPIGGTEKGLTDGSIRRAGLADQFYTEKYKQIPFLHDHLEEEIPLWLGGANLTNLNYITSPVNIQNESIENLVKQYEKVVVFFFRNREIQPDRNYTLTESIVNFCKRTINESTTLFVVCDMHQECAIPISIFQDQRENIFKCKSIKDLCTFFKVCDEFYTFNSGLEDLAKVCACKKIFVFPSTCDVVTKPTWEFNPFNTEVKILKREEEF